MRITKEKVLFLIATLMALLVLANVRLPGVEPVPAVPPEEGPRTYRTVSAGPRLAPEERFDSSAARDPFRSRDPWERAAPALLAVPPADRWPRALPGGVAPQPASPRDRLLLRAEPRAPAPPPAGEGSGR